MPDPLALPPTVPQAGIDWVERGYLIVFALVLFATCYALNTRHHRFPYFYHPDEPGKAEQVISGKYNFNHPMLLLGASKVAVEVFHIPQKPQAVVEAGRCVSAAFIAGATVMLALLGFLWRGWRAAFVAGAALALHHQLYELSHYMKEDSALLFGLACTLLAAMAYSQAPTWFRAVVLGSSCALAISGKYVGVAALALAVPILWVGAGSPAGEVKGAAQSAVRRRRGAHLGIFAAAGCAVFAFVNWPLLSHLATFGHSFHRELDLVMKGQGDSTRQVPHALYWNVFVDNTTPVIWLLLGAIVCACWQRWSQLTLCKKLLLIFPFAFAVALSFSPKENDRYFLPATAVFTLLAAIGVEALPLLLDELGRTLGNRSWRHLRDPAPRQWIFALATVALLLVQITGWAATKPGWSQYDAAFVRDDIAALIAWMKTDLPANAVVVADSRTGLPNPRRKKHATRQGAVPQKLVVSRLACDEGALQGVRALGLNAVEDATFANLLLHPLEGLQALGTTHVAVSESSYGRFFRRDLQPKDMKESEFARSREFYQDLLRSGEEPLFERERGTVIYLHPGIRVYRLP